MCTIELWILSRNTVELLEHNRKHFPFHFYLTVTMLVHPYEVDKELLYQSLSSFGCVYLPKTAYQYFYISNLKEHSTFFGNRLILYLP